MKNVKLFALFALTLSTLHSCKEKPSLQVNEIDYLNKSEQLIEGVPVDIEMPLVVYGVLSCDTFNILLAQDPKGFIFVYSQDWKLLDVFCHQGRARNEFLERPSLRSKQVFKSPEGHILLPLQDMDCIKVLDVNQSLAAHRAIISRTRDFTLFNDSKGTLNGQEIMIRRSRKYLFLDNDIYNTLEYADGISIEDIEILSEYKVRHDTTLLETPQPLKQILKTVGTQPSTKYLRDFYRHPSRNLIIEPFLVMDYILFYDLDHDKIFAIHQNGSPSFNDDLEQKPVYDSEGNIMYYDEERGCFGDALVTDSYFMVFYFGGEYSMGDENKAWPRCELLFFDWDGNFIKSVKLDTYIDATAFNPQTKILYGIPISESDQDEVLLSYDLSSVIDW